MEQFYAGLNAAAGIMLTSAALYQGEQGLYAATAPLPFSPVLLKSIWLQRFWILKFCETQEPRLAETGCKESCEFTATLRKNSWCTHVLMPVSRSCDRLEEVQASTWKAYSWAVFT